ncbi:MAG TPA: hypothetical protein VKT21_02375 [Thermoplasmata archaeon]|nr:hypothetical protein [Thermoplasmata archaeon]
MARQLARPTSADNSEQEDSPTKVQHLPPIWERQLPPPSLPIGVAILSILAAAIGVVLMVSGVLFVLAYYASLVVPATLVIFHVGNPVGAVVLVVLGAVIALLSSALWHQELWSFYLMVGFLFLGLTYLFFTDSITYLFLIVLAVFIYLIAVRHHFY